MGYSNEYIKRSDVGGFLFLLGACFDYMDVEMNLQERGTANLISEIEGIIREQDDEIERLRSKMRGALAALQTGAALDVVAAIEILRSAE